MSEGLIIYPQNTLHKVLETQIDVSRPIQNNTLLFWILRYLEQKVAGIQSKHTLEAKGRDLFGFARWFAAFNGHELIADWRPRDTQAYLSHLERQGKAATTINRVFASMRRFARWVHEQGDSPLRHGLPTQDIKELTVDEPDCKKLSTRELHRLFKAADNLVLTDTRKNARPKRNRAIFALLYYSGLRVSELTALELSQYRDKYLHDVKRKGKSRSKGLYLSSSCRTYLDDYLESERPRDDPNSQMIPLFLPVSGETSLTRQQVFAILKHIADEANKHSKDNPIEIHPHRLRHTFGAEFREKTGSDTETQQALGHVSLKYVGRYVRKTQQEREDMMEEIAKNF
jgi:site-specific recombinase XerD